MDTETKKILLAALAVYAADLRTREPAANVAKRIEATAELSRKIFNGEKI